MEYKLKTNFLLITIGISIIAVSLLLSEPAFNGSSPGCGGGGCHSFQDGDVSVTVLDNLQVEVTVSGTSSKVGGELVDVNGTVVEYDETNTVLLTCQVSSCETNCCQRYRIKLYSGFNS